MKKKMEELAENHYKKTGWVPTELAVMNFQAGFTARDEMAEKEFEQLKLKHAQEIYNELKRNQDLKASLKSAVDAMQSMIDLGRDHEGKCFYTIVEIKSKHHDLLEGGKC